MAARRHIRFLRRQDNVIYPAAFSRGGKRPAGSADEIACDRAADQRATLAALFLESMLMVGG